jgi:SPP1 gp7 family putative phage head morphogenesis protein
MAQPSPAESALGNSILRRQVLLQRLSEAERRKFSPFLREIDREIRARLGGAIELTSYSQKRLERQLALVDEGVGVQLDAFQGKLLGSLDELAIDEMEFSGKLFDNVLRVDFDLPGIQQVRAAVLSNPLSIKSGSLLKPFVKDWTAAERKAVTGAIRKGVFLGQTNAEIVHSIRGTKARQYQDGMLDVTARNARTIVHTALQHVSSQARQATFDENKDIVASVRWISTLDRKTCQVCRSLDRRVFSRDKGPRAPIHPFCRCTLVPVLAPKFALLEAGGTRASAGAIGGKQVDAGLDYYQWLQTQPKSFIEIALGPKRAQLFVDGGLSAERFAALQLDRNFEPLTLTEMKKLEPLSFARAGL